MSVHAPGEERHEIVIVRRHLGDHDEDHHGGVWKIAFADFMTAMMCFFLVMWLINAANDQTKASIASYFNPVKLVDRSSGGKGLDDMSEGPNALGATADTPQETDGKSGTEGKANAGPADAPNATDLSETEMRSDEHLFADPYAVLAEIASDTGTLQNVSSKGDGGAQDAGPASGASGGESYRDPFAPDFWSQQVATPQNPTEDTVSVEEARAQDTIPAPEVKAGDAPQGKSPLEDLKAEVSAATPPEEDSVKPASEEKPADAEAADAKPAEPDAAAAKAAADIKQELAKAFEAGDKAYDGISVTPTEKGVIISVTDQLDFGMFEIGSAVPHRELVLAMEKIGKTLAGRPGKITISGHTDGRPFQNKNYDNWRLSTARAHSAYYMLVRGGLDEQRIREVAGYADRQLKVKEDPLAAPNRRIEIVLETAE
ncbi:chemotaxis protein MotB [Mesorhizobium albiziae]|uniref:Chemotaxis protein MotB n=1 Tax=Neomesorhizobium albiziae TaxID=335020 RepID=A0A1I4DNA3_9HYPH|nr:MotB family protein [Mesorhizobium albiziae]GLS31319.1 flagellar motor protein MotB [Mesorhizobium albiziae]SFK93817.1 chemotaxis protein MotB [Mesorhizobium albiziae]